MKNEIIAGLDIGSTFVRLVVGQKSSDGDRIQIIGAIETPSSGINKGAVASIEDATSAISACLEKTERLVGLPITEVWTGINGPHIKCDRSRGVVAVSKSNGEITPDDVKRTIEAARALSVPANYEILHVLPVRFSVDNQTDIKDPIGMSGVRLEAEVLIIQGLTSQINNLTKAVYRTGIDIEDLILSPLAAAEAVLTPKQKELGTVLINIGASTTSLAVFEEGEVLHTAVLPIGSEHITSDIAIGLRCPISLAEKIKIEHGTANPDLFDKKDNIDTSELGEEYDELTEPISKKYLAEIIEARVEEIMNKVDLELKKIDRSGLLPAGAFLIGGGAKLAGITEVAKKKLRLPTSVGSNKNAETVIDKVNDISFLTALGLVTWGNQFSGKKMGIEKKWPGAKAINESVNKIKGWFKSLIP
jgi:cell division protein FtsA